VNPDVGAGPLILLLTVAAGSGLFLSRLFRAAHPRDAAAGSVSVSFPLFALSLTGLFLTVQFSLPLSLGLLAALSLVRFRTPVKHPEETAFLMAVVATCVTLGAYKLAFAGALLGAVTLVSAATALRPAREPRHGGLVDVSVLSSLPADVTFPAPAASGLPCALESMSVGPCGARFKYRFPLLAEAEIQALLEELRRRVPAARIAVHVDADRAL
jgi:hypothetical protein